MLFSFNTAYSIVQGTKYLPRRDGLFWLDVFLVPAVTLMCDNGAQTRPGHGNEISGQEKFNISGHFSGHKTTQTC